MCVLNFGVYIVAIATGHLFSSVATFDLNNLLSTIQVISQTTNVVKKGDNVTKEDISNVISQGLSILNSLSTQNQVPSATAGPPPQNPRPMETSTRSTNSEGTSFLFNLMNSMDQGKVILEVTRTNGGYTFNDSLHISDSVLQNILPQLIGGAAREGTNGNHGHQNTPTTRCAQSPAEVRENGEPVSGAYRDDDNAADSANNSATHSFFTNYLLLTTLFFHLAIYFYTF